MQRICCFLKPGCLSYQYWTCLFSTLWKDGLPSLVSVPASTLSVTKSTGIFSKMLSLYMPTAKAVMAGKDEVFQMFKKTRLLTASFLSYHNQDRIFFKACLIYMSLLSAHQVIRFSNNWSFFDNSLTLSFHISCIRISCIRFPPLNY